MYTEPTTVPVYYGSHPPAPPPRGSEQDWLVVDDELAELGYLKQSTTAVPATSTCVTSPRASEDIVLLWEGGWGRENTQGGSIDV